MVSQVDPTDQRLARIKASFALRGTNLHRWCRENGIDPHNARKALIGVWTGPKARLLSDLIEDAAEGRK